MMLKVCPDCFGTNGGHHLCCPNNDGETEYSPEEWEPDQDYYDMKSEQLVKKEKKTYTIEEERNDLEL